MKHISCLAACFCLLFATATRADWWMAIDTHPRHLGDGTWSFSIPIPVCPVGLEFVGSQYDFLTQTGGMAVDYTFNGTGIDFEDGRTFYAIAPTLYDLRDGVVNGWAILDLRIGRFSGIVYAPAELLDVRFEIVATTIMPGRRMGQNHIGRHGGR